MIILAVGVTFVLLLGEIDLSAGYTAGVCVVTIAWLIAQHGVSPWLAIPAGFIIGAAIGTLTGWLVAKVGIPAFVATLAFFLAWQGVVLQIAREGGTIPINNDLIIALVNKNHAPGDGLGALGDRRRRLPGDGPARAPAAATRPASRASRSGPIAIKTAAARGRLGHRHLHPQRQPRRSPAPSACWRACRSRCPSCWARSWCCT